MAGGYLCIASNGHPPAVSRRIQLDVKFRLNRRNKFMYKGTEFLHQTLIF